MLLIFNLKPSHQLISGIPDDNILHGAFWSILNFSTYCDRYFHALHYAIGLPDPFAKVTVLGSRLWYTTKTCQATLNPDWNQQFHL